MNKLDAEIKRGKLISEIKNEVSNQSELAKKMEMHREAVNRMLSAEHSPSLDNFLRLCDATGFKLTMTKK